MKKKITSLIFAAVLLALSFPAGAQQTKKIPRIGFLSASPIIDPGFLEGLRELGYVDKKTIFIEHRSAEGKLERLPELAADLVRLKVGIIVTQGTPAAEAAKKATSTIPVVMATSGDPVGAGLVASLARPAGNITGLSLLNDAVVPKHLEMLKEAVPAMSRLAWMANPAIVPEMLRLKDLQSVGAGLGVGVELTEIRQPDDFDGAFAAVAKARIHAAMIPPNSSYIAYRQRIVALAVKHRLPVGYGFKDFPEAGGLMSYGVNVADLFRRAATYVDKILKGAKPADLPVEQPTKFELVINMNAATQIGLTIPPNLLARADKVIK